MIRKRWIDAAALLFLAALTLAFFWKIALTNRVLAGLDVFAYFYPYRDFTSAALRAGRLPLWNPYLFMGAPLLANSQAAVLYPLNWPLLWLSAPKEIAWSIVLHVWLAGAGTYLFARRPMGLRPLAAIVAAVVFGLGGFLGAQAEHVNQLNASAWLPWLLLCLDAAWQGKGRRRWLALLAGGAVVALVLLAGHTQAAYIVLVGAGVYAALVGFQRLRKPEWQQGFGALALLGAMGAMGAILAVGQLLPTLELSGLSVRSGGLPYNEAVSFSLEPGLLLKAFLPPFLWEPPFSEFVAYVGLLGLALAALGTWVVLKRKLSAAEQRSISLHGRAVLVMALFGVFLAFGVYNPVYYLLYRVMPGFALFRVPARWLLLYSFGTAILAGIGLEQIAHRRARGISHPLPRGRGWGRGRSIPTIVLLLLVVELFVAGRKLAYNRPTAPAAFDSMRTAPAHLLADAASTPGTEPFRFLSMSDILYDPGDLGDLQAMYSSQLSEEAIYDLIVATKMKEVLAYNLPLRYRLFSVDGYDGGLLPIARYVTLERLFLAEKDIGRSSAWSDGRLRQQLRQIPSARLLSLLNVKYVITDKMQDAWIDDVFYDLEHTVPLGQVTLANLPDFEATHLGVVSSVTGTAELADGTPLASLTITGTAGTVVTATLRAGQGAATVLDLGQALRPQRIELRSLLPGEQLQLRGLSLIDERTGTSRTVSVDPAYRLVHSGDVKIYQNLGVLPRAFVVHQARGVATDEEALRIMGESSFDPAATVLLPGETSAGPGTGAGNSTVQIVSYEPEQVQLDVHADGEGWLVLTDTFYPGWVAEVDGQAAPMQRADLYFRAVALGPGEHRVVFRYRPAGTYAGLAVGALAWLLWGITLAVVICRIGRRSASSV
jgi:hypothetical protein